ncbi:hypothetical protein C5F59_003295 [Streptomyces sp. QL37]|uniref:hypothetical protein n=1 Tax=Streptomyces sp. QL37 TaxID=2093747 RepID=UPI0011B0636C|nr:hypothetical protein [Streptomyces sp. QL37]
MRAAELFVEVQRADTKATVLCGLDAALLAVVVAALPVAAEAGWVVRAALVVTSAGAAAALITALLALRPVLPDGTALTGMDGPCPNEVPEAVVATATWQAAEGRIQADARNVARLAALAHRKFRIIRVAVDLTVITLGVAGIGVLMCCFVS